MLPKLPTCLPCPLYGDGQGFVPDLHPVGAMVALLAQNPGADEEAGRKLEQYVGKERVYQKVDPQPLIGATGYALNRDFMPRARLTTPVALLNVLKCRVQTGSGKRINEMPRGKTLKEAVECCSQYLRLDDSATHVIAHGAYAVNYTQGGPVKLKQWRGYELPKRWNERPVFATVHTAVLFRSPKLRIVALKDWDRVGRWYRGEWPLPIPSRMLCPIEESHELGLQVLEDAVTRGDKIALDTEFHYKPTDIPGHHPLTMIGFAWRGEHGMTGVQWVQDFGPLMDKLKVLCAKGHWIFQNAAADLPVMEWNGGPKREEWFP